MEATILDVPLLDLYKEAFKRGLFDFITVTEKGKNYKQEQALQILHDDECEELLFGGGAGGAKSWTGCCWLLFMCLEYPETRWFIGREELKRITESTLITFLKVASNYGATGTFKYNGQKNFLQFTNGSRIDFLELKYQPRDPMFERFGSTEYTGGMIEEAGEVDFGAYDVLKTRIGRQHNEKYGLLGKLYMSCNPKKNWLYTTFYQPFKKGALLPMQRFLSALVQDNPNIPSDYIERLKRTKDKSKRERLLYGNWDYDDDPTAMCSYDAIVSIFTNSHVQGGDKRLTADIARFGSDKARVGVWDGWRLIEHHEFAVSATTEIQDCINAMRAKHGLPANKCIGDSDGVGGGVIDNCGIIGFVNNAKPIVPKETKGNSLAKKEQQEQNYINLQTQCGYGLSEIIGGNRMFIECELSASQKEDITTELSWLKTYKSDDERKLRILPKETIKQNIGRSPDWRDLFLMNYYFELAGLPRETSFGWDD
jgi:phage terminase large subunit